MIPNSYLKPAVVILVIVLMRLAHADAAAPPKILDTHAAALSDKHVLDVALVETSGFRAGMPKRFQVIRTDDRMEPNPRVMWERGEIRMHIPLDWGPIVDIGAIYYDHESRMLWTCIARTAKRQTIVELISFPAQWDTERSWLIVESGDGSVFSLEINHAEDESDRVTQISLSTLDEIVDKQHIVMTIARAEARRDPDVVVVLRKDMKKLEENSIE